jgi:NTE family protein
VQKCSSSKKRKNKVLITASRLLRDAGNIYMVYPKKIFLLFFSLLFITVSFPRGVDTLSVKYFTRKLPFGLTEKIPSPRPVVAIALSGGGARGLAQIGVLKAFEEYNIPIDMIVGTSMGSVVGGLYSAGYSLNEIDSIAGNTDWNYMLLSNRESNRRELFIDQKITEDKAIFALKLKGLTPLLPTSINDGQKLSNFLNLLALQAPLHVKNNFDELKYKFRAVCTDLVSGNAVILGGGSLSQAMRASSSVSFFLSPVRIDSLTLTDGGLVANIPVKIARELGGEYIIAINTTSNLHEKDELDVPWKVADQIVSIPMQQLNLAQLEGANVIITPSIKDKPSTEFNNIDSLVNEGYRMALKYVPAIKNQIDSIRQANLKEKEFYIKNVLVNTKDSEIENNLKSKYSLEDSVSSYEILSDIYDLFETGRYDDIKVIINQNEKYSTLNFCLVEKPIIKKVQFAGISSEKRERVDSVLTKLEGNPFDHELVSDKIFDVLKMYRSEGLSLAEMKWLRYDPRDETLFLEFDEGKVDSIIIEGNSYTNKTIITREFPLAAGRYFSYRDVERGLTNLRNTNLFEDIVLTVEKTGGKNIVVLKVLEKITSLIRFGFRADNEDRFQVSFDVRDENLFGSATELGFLFNGGIRNRSYTVEHKSNRIFNSYITYKINAYWRFNDVYEYSEKAPYVRAVSGEYRQIFYGTSAAVGWQAQRFGNVILQGKYQFDEIKIKDGITSIKPEKTKIISLKLSTTIDTQDKYPYPENGVYFQGYYETAQTALGGDVGYFNVGFDYKNYFTFLQGHTFAPHVTMGFADKTMPVTEQYSLGGQNSFYGLRENEFRGRQIFLTSLEYRYFLPVKIFFPTYFKFRYDLGWIWAYQEDIRFKDLRHGIGTSISFDTPIGPADFSVGKSYMFQDNNPGSPKSFGATQYYFSIGFYY